MEQDQDRKLPTKIQGRIVGNPTQNEWYLVKNNGNIRGEFLLTLRSKLEAEFGASLLGWCEPPEDTLKLTLERRSEIRQALVEKLAAG